MGLHLLIGEYVAHLNEEEAEELRLRTTLTNLKLLISPTPFPASAARLPQARRHAACGEAWPHPDRRSRLRTWPGRTRRHRRHLAPMRKTFRSDGVATARRMLGFHRNRPFQQTLEFSFLLKPAEMVALGYLRCSLIRSNSRAAACIKAACVRGGSLDGGANPRCCSRSPGRIRPGLRRLVPV